MIPKPWHKTPAETPKAHGALKAYLSMGDNRTLRRCAEEFGYSVHSLKKWSSQHEWERRSAAYDSEILSAAMERRAEDRERARQALVDKSKAAIDVLVDIMTDPEAKPSTRVSAAVHVLDRAGVVVPRRVELTGSDGRDLFRRASSAADQWSAEQLAAMASAFGVSDDDDTNG